MRVTDAQQQRIAHDHVRMRHVDLRTQHVRSVRKLARLHPAEQIEILTRGPRTIGAIDARRRHRAAIDANLLLTLRIDVRLPLPDQQLRDVVELREVVAGVVEAVPLEAKPTDILLDRFDIAYVFGRWIRIVEAQIAPPVEFPGDAEVQADRLRVANVQKAVRLGRKSRRRRPAKAAGRNVFGDKLADEVAFRRSGSHGQKVRTKGS